MSFDVFLSYSTKDAITAKAACASLEAAKIRCWMAPRDIVPGARWGASIVRAINECRVMVLIFSRNAKDSAQVAREVDQAISNGKAVVPLRIDDVKPIDELAYYLNTVHWLDALTPPLEHGLQQLTAAVQGLLAATATPAPGAATPHDEAEAAQAQDEARAEDERRLAAGQGERVTAADAQWEKDEADARRRSEEQARRKQPETEARQQSGTQTELRKAERKISRRTMVIGAGFGMAGVAGTAIVASIKWPRTSAPSRPSEVYAPTPSLSPVSTPAPSLLRVLADPGGPNSISFVPHGGTLASGDDDRTIRLWDIVGGRMQRSLTGHYAPVYCVAFAPDGRTLASGGGGGDDAIKLWDAATGALLHTLDGHADALLSVAFAPDGYMLASASADKAVKLWDVASGTLQRTLTGHSAGVRSVDFSPDGRMLVSGSWDKTIKLWTAATGKLERTITDDSGVLSVAFSPDGRSVASGDENKTVKLWAAAEGQLQHTLTGHSGNVYSVGFSPDGRTLASAGEDIRLWDTATGDLQHSLAGNADNISFSSDGRMLASANRTGLSDQKAITLWKLPS